MPRALGEFEQLILLALVRLGDDAYGVTIKQEIERQTGREIYVGAVYTALGRLLNQGYVSSTIGEPTATRGGRRKKHYAIEPDGEQALIRSLEAYRNMSSGIEDQLSAMADRHAR